MIVWGGLGDGNNVFNTGGKYNPSTDSWTATSTSSAPTGGEFHTAVWTGSEMIVWGGVDSSINDVNTGGRYTPGTDSWRATSTTNAPSARGRHRAVWTGSEMIVWGGTHRSFYRFTGGRYNPSTDSWIATSTTNAPSGRYLHTGVFAGSEMIIWGGSGTSGPLNTGGRYCAQAGPAIMLDAKAKKVGGINTVDLTWSGATSTDIDIYRDSVLIVTTANDGSYRDSTGDTGQARYTYQVCEAGTQTCSNNAKVTFPQ